MKKKVPAVFSSLPVIYLPDREKNIFCIYQHQAEVRKKSRRKETGQGKKPGSFCRRKFFAGKEIKRRKKAENISDFFSAFFCQGSLFTWTSCFLIYHRFSVCQLDKPNFSKKIFSDVFLGKNKGENHKNFTMGNLFSKNRENFCFLNCNFADCCYLYNEGTAERNNATGEKYGCKIYRGRIWIYGADTCGQYSETS